MRKKIPCEKYLGKHVKVVLYRGLRGQRSKTIEGRVTIVRGPHLFVADMDVNIRNNKKHRGNGIWITMLWDTKDTIKVIKEDDTK